MCLITLEKNSKIAESDIVVYKTVNTISNRKAESTILNYTYLRMQQQPPVKLAFKHHYLNTYRIDEGYHAYIEPINGANAVFVIPKGSEIVIDKNNKEIVASSIIFIGRLRNWFTRRRLKKFLNRKK